MNKEDKQKQFEKCLEEEVIRFAVGSSEIGFSNQWRFWLNKSEIYLGVRVSSHNYKISLHETGECHLALQDGLLESIDQQKRKTIPSRYLRQWTRKPTPTKGFIHTASVFFPTARLTGPEPKKNKFNITIEPGKENEAVEFCLYQHLEHPELILKLITQPRYYICSYNLPNGEWITLFFRLTPFNMDNLQKIIQHDDAKHYYMLGEMEPGIPEDAHMITFYQSADDGTFYCVDLGPAKLTKNLKNKS